MVDKIKICRKDWGLRFIRRTGGQEGRVTESWSEGRQTSKPVLHTEHGSLCHETFRPRTPEMASSHLTVPMGGLVEFNPWNQMTQLANKIIAHWQRICYFKVREQSMITTVYQTAWLTVISGSMKTNKNLTKGLEGNGESWREARAAKHR